MTNQESSGTSPPDAGVTDDRCVKQRGAVNQTCLTPKTRGRKPQPTIVGVDEVDLRQYLALRGQLLTYQASAIKGRIRETEAELARVQTAIDALDKT